MRKTARISMLFLLAALAGCAAGYGLTQRQAFVDDPLHSYLTDNERQAVLKGAIYQGMPRDLLLASWGPPYDVNVSQGSYGKREQFVYRFTRSSRCYVYVDDGLVTSWQY